MNDLNLACFISVARTLNFSVSARILSVPQQTVSRNIQKLEEELGHVLIKRDSQTVELTKAGEDFYRWAEALDLKMQSANISLRRNPLSLSFGWGDWTGCPHQAEEAIRIFQKNHPSVELHLAQGSHAELLNFLDNGVIDLALIPDRFAGASLGYQLEKSEIKMPLFILVSANNPLFKFKQADTAVLSELPQLVPPLFIDSESNEEIRALSDIFSCAFSHGEIRRVSNVGSSYTGLLGSSAYTISPLNSRLKEQSSITPFGNVIADTELVFLRPLNSHNPWSNILIQLIKEAAR